MFKKKDFKIKSWLTIKYGLQGKIMYKNMLLYYTSKDYHFNNDKNILREKLNTVIDDIIDSCKSEQKLFFEKDYSQKYKFLS